jgi:hypothetical protein
MKQSKNRKTDIDRMPVRLDKVAIIRAKAKELNKTQVGLLDELLTLALRVKRWAPETEETAAA